MRDLGKHDGNHVAGSVSANSSDVPQQICGGGVANATAPAGVTISIDDNDLMLRVTAGAGVSLPKSFVRACHEQAGELGYGIEFARG